MREGSDGGAGLQSTVMWVCRTAAKEVSRG